MAERTAIEVTVDDAGAVTVHLHELDEIVRRAALAAVARALGAPASPSEPAPTGSAQGDEWRRAWDAELAERIARADEGAAKWVSLDDARERLRVVAQRGR